MKISAICNRDVVVVTTDLSARDAARLMRDHHVGCLVVVDDTNGDRTPVGILTDRDLVVELLAPDIEPDDVTVGDFMSAQPVTVVDDEGVEEALQLMRHCGVRRLPVVDEDGALAGIVALDDMIELVAGELLELVGIIKHEQRHERRSLG